MQFDEYEGEMMDYDVWFTLCVPHHNKEFLARIPISAPSSDQAESTVYEMVEKDPKLLQHYLVRIRKLPAPTA